MDEKKISRSSWRVSLQQTATKLNRGTEPPRIAVLGVGNELRGDDAAGVFTVRNLQQKGLASSQFLLLDTGPSPENFTSPVVKFSPDWIIMIDAARLNYRPGRIACFSMDEVGGVGAFTHGLPLSMIGEYLVETTHCVFSLLGIQLAHSEFGQAPVPEILRAVNRLSLEIGNIFNRVSR
jgi:hydrogenase 3 maturation protease